MRTILFIVLAMIEAGCCSAQWTEPVLVDDPYDSVGINTPWQDWCPFVTANSQKMYFSSRRRDGYDDIYVSNWGDSNWGSASRLPFCLPNVDERNPAVNVTDDTLYFVTWGAGWDIYWSFRTGPCDTCWGEPSRMPEPINSSGIEFSVWATPDNGRLLFSSWRNNNMEDIYECRRDYTSETGWSAPHTLTGYINSWRPESYPSMGNDTSELFFCDSSYPRLLVSSLTDSGWMAGVVLPDIINRVIIDTPSEQTPCITPDGRRLYFYSRWSDSGAVSGDIWYSERTVSVPREDRHHKNDGMLFDIFPNPVRDGFTIRLGAGIKDLLLFNVLGQIVESRTVDGWSHEVYWPITAANGHFSTGVYFLVAQSATKSMTIPLIIVK